MKQDLKNILSEKVSGIFNTVFEGNGGVKGKGTS